MEINTIEKLRLQGNMFSAVIKLLYAFLWQGLNSIAPNVSMYRIFNRVYDTR